MMMILMMMLMMMMAFDCYHGDYGYGYDYDDDDEQDHRCLLGPEGPTGTSEIW